MCSMTGESSVSVFTQANPQAISYAQEQTSWSRRRNPGDGNTGAPLTEATAKVPPKAKGKQGNGRGKQTAPASYLQLTAEQIYFY